METVLIAGGSGFLGKKITALLETEYNIHILTRDPSKHENTPKIKYFAWDTEKQTIDAKALEADHIINLAGVGIADERWTEERKKLIIDSRVQSVQTLRLGIEKSGIRPKTFLSASAIGIYGDRGDEILTEASAAGIGFLSESCIQWETAVKTLKSHVDRLGIFRFGIVLSLDGGALPKMLVTRSINVFPYFGDGSMWMSWVHVDDVSNAVAHFLKNETLSGTFNIVSPHPIRNKDFVFKLRDVSGGGLAIPSPAFALKLAMGEMSHIALDSTRVMPAELVAAGYEFEYSDVERALGDILG